MLKTFHDCVGLPIQVIDDSGNILEIQGSIAPFCSRLNPYLPADDTCAMLHAKAAKQAMALGETYIFSCHASLNHIVFPLIHKNALLGAILAGPFLMDDPDSLLISDVGRRYTIPSEDLLELYDDTHSLPVVPPAKVTQISHLLYYLFSGLISQTQQQFIANQEKLYQQSRINEAIQRYKISSDESETEYPYETEKELIARVKVRDATQAKALLNDLLGYVFFSAGNDLEVIKARAIELCSLLSRAAIEGGATNNTILKMNNQFIRHLQDIQNLDDLCYSLQKTLDAFTENMFE